MKGCHQDDTIAAVSTPAGEGGIGIIRLSGPAALPAATRIFKPKKKRETFESHRLYYGEVVNPDDGAVLDECLLSYMKGPNSFTREDVVELNCHGGTVALQSVMELLMREEVRHAEPGEFTKRAFMNGRLDLSQAEAVIDLIRAKTERSLRLAQVQLKGGLKEALFNVREGLLETLSILEAYTDFPEEEIDKAALTRMEETLSGAARTVEELLSTYDEGRILREGIHVVIAGRPNTGKSSLLNALLKEKRAIVTAVPGTTRDVIEEVVNIKGIPVNLIDTAGIRETEDVVEGEGIKRTLERLREADIVLYMVDEKGVDATDATFIDGPEESRRLLVINKADLMKTDRIEEIGRSVSTDWTAVSCEKGTGLDELKEALYRTVLSHGPGGSPEVAISRKRQKVALEGTRTALERTKSGIAGGEPFEVVAIDLRDALAGIAEVAGETTPDEVLNRIFSDFCIGK